MHTEVNYTLFSLILISTLEHLPAWLFHEINTLNHVKTLHMIQRHEETAIKHMHHSSYITSSHALKVPTEPT